MRRAVTIWPTQTEAQDRVDLLGNAHVIPNGATWLACPNELGGSATRLIATLGAGARSSDPDTSHQAAAIDHTTDRVSGPGGHAIKDIDQFPEDLRIREYPSVS